MNVTEWNKKCSEPEYRLPGAENSEAAACDRAVLATFAARIDAWKVESEATIRLFRSRLDETLKKGKNSE